MDCNTCDKRRQCCAYELCLAAERYANRDYIGQREHCFSYIDGCQPNQIPNEDNAFLMAIPSTKIQIQKLFFIHHLKIMEIADITYRSKQYVSKIIAQCRTQLRTTKRLKKAGFTI